MSPLSCPVCGKEPRVEFSSARPANLAWATVCVDPGTGRAHAWNYASGSDASVRGWNRLVRNIIIEVDVGESKNNDHRLQ